MKKIILIVAILILSNIVNAKENMYYRVTPKGNAFNVSLLNSDVENLLSNAGFNPVQVTSAITESGFVMEASPSATFGGIGDISYAGVGMAASLSYVCSFETGNLTFYIGMSNVAGRAGIENDDISRRSDMLDNLNSNLLRGDIKSLLDILDQNKFNAVKNSVNACNELKLQRTKNKNQAEISNQKIANKHSSKHKDDLNK